VVAVTGASGTIYARLLVEELLRQEGVGEIALIFSENGRAVACHEGQAIATGDPRVRVFDNGDMFAPPASGSADYDAMVVVPCSMGTAGRVANGISDSLIARAADVMLKERRRLIVVPRETPLSTIHLRNMLTLSECGAVVVPASPSFYSHPADIDRLCMTVVERIVSLLGLDSPRYRWGEE
jgi:4-hydroxy-3-polyprenylbenzoate decarboxylase